jgi:hypothetical protein
MFLLSPIKGSRKNKSSVRHANAILHRSGFTLFELLTAAVISAFMTGIVLLIYTALRNAYWQGTNVIGAQEGAKIAMMQIKEVLGNACPPSPIQDALVSPSIGGNSSEVEFWEPCGGLSHPLNPNSPLYTQCSRELQNAGVKLKGGGLFFNPQNPFYTEMVLSLLKNQVVLYNVQENLTLYQPEQTANFITNVNFDRLEENALEVTITKQEVSKNAAGQNKIITSQAEQIIFFPQK